MASWGYPGGAGLGGYTNPYGGPIPGYPGAATHTPPPTTGHHHWPATGTTPPPEHPKVAHMRIVSSPMPYTQMEAMIQAVAAVVNQFNSLAPSTRVIFPLGQPLTVAALEGTIAVTHSGNTYHIPISVSLPFGFPMEPPVIRVEPTAGMGIAERNHNVQQDGIVKLGGLDFWHHSHDLPAVVGEAQRSFSIACPVYSRAANSPPQQPLPDPRPTPPLNANGRTDSARFLSGDALTPGGGSGPGNAPSQEEEMLLVRITSLVESGDGESLLKQLQSRKQELEREAAENRAEVDAGEMRFATLRSELEGGLREDEIIREWSLTQLLGYCRALGMPEGSSLEEVHRVATQNPGAINIDAALSSLDTVEATSVLKSQHDNAAARASAWDDVLYSLDKAFEAKTLPCKEWIHQVRQASKEQFISKAGARRALNELKAMAPTPSQGMQPPSLVKPSQPVQSQLYPVPPTGEDGSRSQEELRASIPSGLPSSAAVAVAKKVEDEDWVVL